MTVNPTSSPVKPTSMQAVQLLLNSYLPEDMRDYTREYTKKGITTLLNTLAEKHPDKYSEIVHKIARVGRENSYLQGETIGLEDLMPVFDKQPTLDLMHKKLKTVNQVKDPVKRKKMRMALYLDTMEDLHKQMMGASLKKKTTLINSVLSGARGNPTQLRSMIVGPGLYADYKDDPIDLFVEDSYSEGLRPADYLASTFGARKSVIATKSSTADAGFLGKQMGFNAADLIITSEDSGSSNGIFLPTEKRGDLKGRVLARDVGQYKAGTIIDKRVIVEIEKLKLQKIMVKSPLTSNSAQGLDAASIGMMPDKRTLKVGDMVGLTASTASSEPVIQGSLSTKHLSGAVKGKKMEFSGFSFINQMMQSPKMFPKRGVLSEKDGFVENIEEAPQGGYYITVGEEKHYTGPEFEPIVKLGQEVEAGEQLGDGLVDPKDVLRLRGVGEARKYYVDRLKQIYDDSGAPSERINFEILARNAINHISLEDNTDYPDIIPDSVISYNSFASRYKPASDSSELTPKKAVGMYLQSPALHYTIGTRLTPRMARELDEGGFNSVYASKQEPPFKPVFVRLMTATDNNEDWLARMNGNYLGKNLQRAAEEGQETNIESNTHFAPRLAYGKNFGDKVTQTGKF